jgi:hypothetical protein
MSAALAHACFATLEGAPCEQTDDVYEAYADSPLNDEC